MDSIWQGLWDHAAQGADGSGLDHGVDFTVLNKHTASYRKHGLASHAAMLECAASNCCWTRSRRNLAGYDVDTTCQRCLSAPDTAFHRVWECQANDQVDQDDFRKSRHLAAQANRAMEKGEDQCFWLRGLVPKRWTETPLPEQRSGPWKVGTANQTSPPRPSYVYVDGSGTTADRRTRRCGWSVAWLGQDVQGQLSFSGGFFGGLGNEAHTVFRAELVAFLMALELVVGDITVYSDCLSVVNGFEAGLHLWPAGPHFDVWEQIGKAINTRQGGVKLKWVKAHANADDIKKYSMEAHEVYGNYAADALAKKGAQTVQLSDTRLIEIEMCDSMAWLVQRRIVAAHIATVSADPIARSSPDVRMQPRLKGPSLRQKLVEESGHDLDCRGNHWHCKTCGRGANEAKLHQWLRAAT